MQKQFDVFRVIGGLTQILGIEDISEYALECESESGGDFRHRLFVESIGHASRHFAVRHIIRAVNKM